MAHYPGFEGKLRGLEEGLFKLVFSYKRNPQEEIAYKFDNNLGAGLMIPNNAWPFYYYLRSILKSPQDKTKYAIPGYMISDNHIQTVQGRIVTMNDSYAESENINPLLIPANSPCYDFAVNFLYTELLRKGFDVDHSSWDDYKKWELERLKSF
jgi:hypothetical protein